MNITGTLSPTGIVKPNSAVPVFSRMQRARSVRQDEYLFLKTGFKFKKTFLKAFY